MDKLLVGREPQIKELLDALVSERSELVAVYGRRRVGKTFLIREVYGERIDFEIAGLLNGKKSEQLQNFTFTLRKYFPDYELDGKLQDWLSAFDALGNALDQVDHGEKRVLFFDELPWLASARSGFLRAFGNFWNTYVEKRKLVIVICGSAAAWMIRRVIQNRGGLHNRITRLLPLAPFTFAEAAAFCQARGMDFSTYQLLQVYMTFGGVAAYLEQLRPGQSAVQNIQRVCFERTGFLRGEFDRLYASLFADYDQHLRIVRQLASKRSGMTREALRKATNLPSGGALTRLLDELYESGFIGIYTAFDKRKKRQLYRLIDPYSLFYLTFIERLSKSETVNFTQLSELSGWSAWSGYSFENVWLMHTDKIKAALGIEGVNSRVGTYLAKSTEEAEGVQIDLLIDRKDHVINICEAKFSPDVFTVSKAVVQALARKKSTFKAHTATKKQLSVILLTVYGTTKAASALDHVDGVLTVEDLL